MTPTPRFGICGQSENAQGLRVIVRLEPTLDDDDTLPGSELRTAHAWAHELQLRTHQFVQLEAIDELLTDGIEVTDGVIACAALGWRDPTVS